MMSCYLNLHHLLIISNKKNKKCVLGRANLTTRVFTHRPLLNYSITETASGQHFMLGGIVQELN